MMNKFLSSIDLFGTPIMINFSRKEKFKSSCGGICTLIFCGFLIWTIYTQSINLFSKSNPNAVTSESFVQDPSEIIITVDSFPIALGLQAPDTLEFIQFYDESIYKLNLYHVRQERITDNNGNATLNVIYTDIATEECTPDHFGELGPSFATLSLDLLYCIAKEQPIMQRISISGTPESMIYEALTVRIAPCNNDTSSITCSTPEKIEEYLDGSWFYAYYANMAVDPKNYTRPDIRYRDTFYAMIGPSNYRYSIFNLGHIDVITDSGWIIESSTTKSYVGLDQAQDYEQFKPHSDGLLITFDIQLSQRETHYYRSYTKIQSVIAGIGGIANAVLIALIICTAPYMKVKFYESIMNERFDIDFSGLPPDPRQKPKKTKSKPKPSKRKRPSNSAQKEKDEVSAISTYRDKSDIKLYPTKVERNFDITSLESPNTTNLFLRKEKTEEISSTREAGITLQDSPRKDYKIPQETNPELCSPNSIHAENYSTRDLIKPTKMFKKVPAKQIEDPIDNQNWKDVSFFSDFSLPSPYLNNSKSEEKIESDIKITIKNKNSATRKSEDDIDNKEENMKAKLDDCNVIEEISFHKQGKEVIHVQSVEPEPKKLEIGFFEFMFSCLRRSKATRFKLELIKKGRTNIEERLDVLNLIVKLREIDKIRTLLLEYDQLLLFNSLPKPRISLNKAEEAQRKLLLNNGPTIHINDAESDQIKGAFERLNNKAIKSKMDIKILEAYKEAFKISEKNN